MNILIGTINIEEVTLFISAITQQETSYPIKYSHIHYLAYLYLNSIKKCKGRDKYY